jgi:hypothetical protein
VSRLETLLERIYICVTFVPNRTDGGCVWLEFSLFGFV